MLAKKVLLTSHRAAFGNSFNAPLINSLKKMGAEVHYAADGEVVVNNCDKQFTLPIKRNPFHPSNLRAYFQLKKIINQEGYDLVHCHTPTASVITRFAAVGARLKFNTFVMYTAHGFHFFRGASKINWILFYPLEKILARFTDMLITINQEDYNRAKAKFNTRVEYIPGIGLDTEKISHIIEKSDVDNVRNSLGLTDEDFVIVYPAEISKRKRQIWLINTISSNLHNNKDMHLILPGMDSMNGEVQEYVKNLELQNQIHFLGYRNDIYKLLEVSDLAVSSSLQEGLPVNVMEALYIGLPIIATDCRGNEELLNGIKGCYMVAKNDATGFSVKLSEAYENRRKTTRKNRLDKKFYSSTVTPKMENYYKEVLL
jgi:glycosyltransferase EpsD